MLPRAPLLLLPLEDAVPLHPPGGTGAEHLESADGIARDAICEEND